MKYISSAYRSFKTDDAKQIEDEVRVWWDILQDIPFEVGMESTRYLCRVNTKWAPTPAEIYQACKKQKSFYELQRAEEEADQLALEAYNEESIPIPDHILERLERLQANRKVNDHES